MPDCVRFNIVPGIAVIAIGLVWGTAPVMAQSKKPLLRLGERPVAVVSPKIDCTSVSRSSYYGHLPYAQAPQEELVSIGNGERLRRG
ncbi:MAG: hypothetical protein WBD58_18285, partial [Geitlerinemataceae cyanobacterium]